MYKFSFKNIISIRINLKYLLIYNIYIFISQKIIAVYYIIQNQRCFLTSKNSKTVKCKKQFYNKYNNIYLI